MKPSSTTILIAQASGLGDVVATLPMACAIKRRDPKTKVLIAGRPYSRMLIEASKWVDQYVDADQVIARPAILAELGVGVLLNPYQSLPLGIAARRAGVPIRVGKLTPRAVLWANRFVPIATHNVQRHRAALNLAFLKPLGINTTYSNAELGGMLGLDTERPLEEEWRSLLDPRRFNLVLHPKSNLSGREWPSHYFDRLVDLLPAERVKVFVSGQSREREQLISEHALIGRGDVVDLTGRLDLGQLMGFLKAADGLVSSGTGPLHIAGALGIHALGLFPGRNRITAARWTPLGNRGESLSSRTVCKPGPGRCARTFRGGPCPCMNAISPEAVAAKVMAWIETPPGANGTH